MIQFAIRQQQQQKKNLGNWMLLFYCCVKVYEEAVQAENVLCPVISTDGKKEKGGCANSRTCTVGIENLQQTQTLGKDRTLIW